MYLLILAYSALASTVIWYTRAKNDLYKLKYLAAILWGATTMVFIDHLYSYIAEGGEFLNMSTNSAVLGFSMLLIALLIWLLMLLVKDPRNVFHGEKQN